MANYPHQVPSGVNIIPEASGVDNLGSSDYPFNAISVNNLSGTITLASGTSILNAASGINNLGSETNPFNTAHIQNAGVGGAEGVVTISVSNEIPAGLISGTNVNFSLSESPYSNTLKLYKDGLYMFPSGVGSATFDYSLVGNTITYANPPISGSKHIANYEHI